MSFGSPADIIPFSRFLDCRQRRNRIAAADATVAMPASTGTAGSGQDVSFENSPTFDLIGGDLNAHLGHKVEVIGITSDTKLNKSDSFRSAIGSSTQDKATLTVSSVKMMAAKCP